MAETRNSHNRSDWVLELRSGYEDSDTHILVRRYHLSLPEDVQFPSRELEDEPIAEYTCVCCADETPILLSSVKHDSSHAPDQSLVKNSQRRNISNPNQRRTKPIRPRQNQRRRRIKDIEPDEI